MCVCGMFDIFLLLVHVCAFVYRNLGGLKFCGVLCGEIAAARRREEEEKQRKKAKLAAKLRKLMEAEAKSEKKRFRLY